MLAGVLLVGVLQRSDAHSEKVASAQPVAARRSVGTREQGFLGVVIAGHSAELASESDGRVSEVYARAGKHVDEGDLILQIDRGETAAAIGVVGAELAQRQSDVARAEARLEATHRKLERLSAGGAWLSAQEFDAARSEVRVAEAELRAARSLVSMGRARLAQTRVRDKKHTLAAPFSGTLVSVEADPGDTVTAGRVLARVISDDRRIQFALPKEQLPPAQEAMTEVWVVRDGLTGPLRARVFAVRPEVDAAAQLVFATASLPDDAAAANWMPGTDVWVFRSPDAVPSLLPKL